MHLLLVPQIKTISIYLFATRLKGKAWWLILTAHRFKGLKKLIESQLIKNRTAIENQQKTIQQI